jgi:hypothetical protein
MDDYLQILRHDAFRYGGGLNKSAAEVYWWLMQSPLSADSLIQKTGRSRTTIFRCLQRMSGVVDSRNGEVVSIVRSKDGIWSLEPGVELDRIALLIGTAGIGKRKREQYAIEQKKHRIELKRGREAENYRINAVTDSSWEKPRFSDNIAITGAKR